MRIATKTIYDAVKFNLADITSQLNKANTMVASGKRIITPSDDPVGLNQALNIKSALSNLEQLGRNIDLGKSWLEASESALSQVRNLISDTKALTVQMATGTTSASQRANAALTVQNTLEEIVSLANRDVNGRYIFSGSQTDTTPFRQDGTYDGDTNPFEVKIARNAVVEVGQNGTAVFGTLFTTLSDLKTALEDNNIGGIQNAMGNLDNHFNHISTEISDIGSKMIRMEIKENIYQDLSITNTSRLGEIEDVDMAEAILELKSIEVAYQAALASSSQVMRLSLVDYL
jgi:flagellar hook-associated protein 3 FlgL